MERSSISTGAPEYASQRHMADLLVDSMPDPKRLVPALARRRGRNCVDERGGRRSGGELPDQTGASALLFRASYSGREIEPASSNAWAWAIWSAGVVLAAASRM